MTKDTKVVGCSFDCRHLIEMSVCLLVRAVDPYVSPDVWGATTIEPLSVTIFRRWQLP
jgi:hypothetical protein